MPWTIGRVRGIAIRIHWTLLLVLPLFAYVMAIEYFSADGLGTVPILWGSALAVTLFASVLLHEFSHSFMAQRLGGEVSSILLMPLGGVSQIESLPERPKEEFQMTVVGPITNFVIAFPLLLVAGFDLVPAGFGSLGTFILWAGLLNVALGAFNLFLPAFPMDGGRILRAALSTRMSRRKATHIAAVTGRTLAVVLAVLGFLAFGVGGIWLLLIAFFIFVGAGVEEQQATAHALLSDVSAEDLMSPDPVVIDPGDTLSSVQERMLSTHHTTFPVEDDGRLVGCLGLQEMVQVPADRFRDTKARDVMREDVATAERDTPAKDVLKAVQKSEHHHVVVVDKEHVVGVISGTDLERMLQILNALESHERLERQGPFSTGGRPSRSVGRTTGRSVGSPARR